MRIARVIICVLLVLGNVSFLIPAVNAVDSDSLVISQVQAGNVSSSRLVEIYNNSDYPADITGWCVKYVAAGAALSNTSTSVRACFDGSTQHEHLLLPARTYLLVGSAQLGVAADYIMTEGLGSGSSGKVYITDSQNNVIDVFGWGDKTTNAEGTPKSSSDNSTKVYEREQSVLGTYTDTDDNSKDFFDAVLKNPYEIGNIVEVMDVCQNIADIQVTVPNGFVLTENNQCSAMSMGICENIDGTQMTLPLEMEVDDDGNCYIDTCTNLPGFQDVVPAGFQANHQKQCSIIGLLPIRVTELLPNPDGDDKYSEFIELYNPNNTAVDLTYHLFHLHGDFNKVYSFPAGLTIEPLSYLAVYNKDITFTLTNTWGSLRLRTLDNTFVFDVPAYSDAKSGQAWAIIDGGWQYTAAPTPGAENEAVSAEFLLTSSLLSDCGEGRERNPLTNRCRNIATAKSTVKPCKDGQYRSEETNRCRNVLGASTTRKPCKDNQYRSEETGRCRNLAASTMPDAAFAVQPIKDSGVTFVGWWVLGGVGLLAVSYGIWEWRREIATLWHRLVKH